MNVIANALVNLTSHIYENLTLYIALIGVMCILSYIYIIFGTPYLILGTGVFLIITSIIRELNRIKRAKESPRRY